MALKTKAKEGVYLTETNSVKIDVSHTEISLEQGIATLLEIINVLYDH